MEKSKLLLYILPLLSSFIAVYFVEKKYKKLRYDIIVFVLVFIVILILEILAIGIP